VKNRPLGVKCYIIGVVAAVNDRRAHWFVN